MNSLWSSAATLQIPIGPVSHRLMTAPGPGASEPGCPVAYRWCCGLPTWSANSASSTAADTQIIVRKTAAARSNITGSFKDAGHRTKSHCDVRLHKPSDYLNGSHWRTHRLQIMGVVVLYRDAGKTSTQSPRFRGTPCKHQGKTKARTQQ